MNATDLYQFAQLVRRQQVASLRAADKEAGFETPQERIDCFCCVKLSPGRSWWTLSVASLPKLMIHNKTGEIFGVCPPYTIDRRRPYGTIETVDKWYWGEFRPRPVSDVAGMPDVAGTENGVKPCQS